MPRVASPVLGAMIAAILLASCAPQIVAVSPQNPPSTSWNAQRLRFAWPLPAAATVTDVVDRTGRGGKMRIRIRLEAMGPREQLLLSFDEFTVTEIDGAPIEGRRQIGRLLPGLLLTTDGKVSDTTDLTPILEQSIELVGRGQGDAERSVRALLESPFARSRVQQGVHRYWRHWVELWDDLPVPRQSGQHHSFDIRRVDSDGIERGYRNSVELRSDSDEETIEVWQVQAMDAVDAAELIRVRTMESLEVVAMPASAPTVTDASMTVSAGARLNPATLRPQWIDVTTHIQAKLNGLPTDTTERHHYAFSWDG